MLFDGDDPSARPARQEQSGIWAQLLPRPRERPAELVVQPPRPSLSPRPHRVRLALLEFRREEGLAAPARSVQDRVGAAHGWRSSGRTHQEWEEIA